jgi:hypothetical protein
MWWLLQGQRHPARLRHGTNRGSRDENIRSGQNRKREASREYAWFDRTDSGIIRPPWNRNLIGK